MPTSNIFSTLVLLLSLFLCRPAFAQIVVNSLDDPGVATSYDDDLPYTPAWQERITGVDRRNVIQTAREFAHDDHVGATQHVGLEGTRAFQSAPGARGPPPPAT